MYLTYSATDIGTTRTNNQDTVGILVNTHSELNAAMGVVCDGVGGLKEGEYASRTTFQKFVEWFQFELPQIAKEDEFGELLRKRWIKLIENHNRYLYEHAMQNGIRLGTTLTALLLFENKYYVVQVGDSRAYQVTERVVQLTEDQSLVAKEVRQGIITEEEARSDSRKNVLLQSVGYSKNIVPEFSAGNVEKNAGFLICSDGFYHFLKEEELIACFGRNDGCRIEHIKSRVDGLISDVKDRGEKDNISVAYIGCCGCWTKCRNQYTEEF